MANLLDTIIATINGLNHAIPVFSTILLLCVLFVIFNVIATRIKKKLTGRLTNKNQIHNFEVLFSVTRYGVIALLIVFGIFSYTNSWEGIGITAGVLTAALGFALQRPITGIAAWLMIIIKRPFRIGDRILVGSVKGDVFDLTLSHVYLKETGGIFPSEENSGRIILIPNSLLFEQNIINYTLTDQYILDQVVTPINYESDLTKAKKIALEAAKLHTKQFDEQIRKEPYIRTFFGPSAVDVHVRYYAPAQRLQEFSSAITEEIFTQIRKTRDVSIAYPHMHLVIDKKVTKSSKNP